MYFKGRLSIDPSELTKIERVAPDSGFKKILFSLTGGQFAEKNEVETFKALNILQQIRVALSSNGIDNIIRLTHDDIDIYFDKYGERNDLNYAMDKYQIEVDDAMSTHFNTLWMVLEHDDETFKYLIEISVNRNHKENEYPIEMVVSAMLKEFTKKEDETRDELKERMQKCFSSQEEYNMFLTTQKLAFEQFLESIRFDTRKYMRVDDIKMEIKTRMVIQKEKEKDPDQPIPAPTPEYHGMPYGYFGFGDLLLYSWLWSELSYDHNIHMSDVDMVTEQGDFVTSIGEEGIDAGDASVMDYSEDFDTRMEDVDTSGAEMADVDSGGMEEVVDDETTKSWFDDMFDGDSSFDFDDW